MRGHWLRLSMEYHERFNINAPPHNEVFLELGLRWEELTLTARARHDWGWNLGSHSCEPSVLPLSYHAIPSLV